MIFLDLHRLPQAGRLDEGQHSCGFCCVLIAARKPSAYANHQQSLVRQQGAQAQNACGHTVSKTASFLRLIRALLAEQDEYEGLSTSRYRHQVSRLGFEVVSSVCIVCVRGGTKIGDGRWPNVFVTANRNLFAAWCHLAKDLTHILN